MPTFKKCPRCAAELEEVELAVHLMQAHGLAYSEAMDWIRAQEESCGC